MRYMLDTDICIHAINERPAKVLQALHDHHAEGLGVSSITASELFFGVAERLSAQCPGAQAVPERVGGG